MAYKRRIVEVTLARLALALTGARRTESNHVVVARLICPRPAIAEKVAVSTVSLSKGSADLCKGKWIDRILFKEQVMGPFGIAVEVSGALSNTAIDSFMKVVASTALKVAGDEIEDAAGPWLGGLVNVPLKHMTKLFSSGSDGPAPIGCGAADLCADATWQAGKPRKLAIPLAVENDVTETHRVRRGGRLTTRRRTVLKAGEANGFVELSLSLYD